MLARLSALPETGELRPGELLQVGDEEVEALNLGADRGGEKGGWRMGGWFLKVLGRAVG